MIGRLHGCVVDEEADRVVIDIGGIGYEVVVPPYQMKVLRARYLPADDPKARLMNLDTPVSLYIHHHASERNPLPTLYGFNEANERRFFVLLIGISRFGPTAAAKSMIVSVPDYASKIMTRDVRALSKLPGIGAAKAEQMIAALRSKVALFAMMTEEKLPEAPVGAQDSAALQAQIALEDLGFKGADAEAIVQTARNRKPDAATVEELLDVVWAIQREQRK